MQHKTCVLGLVCLALIPLACAVDAPLSKIKVKGQHMYDDHGRLRLFHGMNAVRKEYPWYPDWLRNEAYLDEIASWGFNVVRLGWMWSGFEPREGTFNSTYYDIQAEIVEKLAKRGIHTLLDTHQDVLSSLFCLYDGIPLWLAKKCTSTHKFPWPLHGNCSSRGWMTNELTQAAGKCYQEIYDNVAGMKDSFAKFWEESAKRWTGNPNILGYELINEPFAGDVYKHPTLFVPGNAGKKNLQPLYNTLQGPIRKHDNQTLIFYEPVTWGMVKAGKMLGTGFSQVPGGPKYADRSVLSFHYYCFSFGSVKALCDKAIAPSVFNAIKKDITKTGGSAFMTEWGGCDGGKNLKDCPFVADAADKAWMSWMEYSGFAQKRNHPSKEHIDVLSRPYARAVAGTVQNMTFSHADATKRFEFCYTIDGSIDAPTEVFIPATRHYAGRPQLGISPSTLKSDFDHASGILLLHHTAADNGKHACVRVTKVTSGNVNDILADSEVL